MNAKEIFLQTVTGGCKNLPLGYAIMHTRFASEGEGWGCPNVLRFNEAENTYIDKAWSGGGQ